MGEPDWADDEAFDPLENGAVDSGPFTRGHGVRIQSLVQINLEFSARLRR